MLDDLVSVIETLQQRIRTHGATLRENETRTRMALIDPLLAALGWDVSDPALVTPEYNVSGRWADYALLRPDGQPAATIEAKKLGESLTAHRMQMLNYSNASGVEYAGLTDGDHWELYEVFQQGQLEDRRILDVSIANMPTHELALQLLLLWRPNLASGQPVAAREPVLGTIPVPEPAQSGMGPTTLPVTPVSQTAAAEGWVSLSFYQRGTKPPAAIRFADGEEQPIQLWRHLVERTAAWLWSTGKLNQSNVPVKTRGRRYIVGLNSVHSDGKPFVSPFPIAGSPLHYEGNIGGPTPVENTKTLLQHCDVDSATIHLMTAASAPDVGASDKAPPEASYGWIPLPNFNPPRGSKPPEAIKFPDGTIADIGSWRQLPSAVAGWLYAKQLLTLETIPITSGRRGFAANDKPIMRDGQPMTTYDVIGDGDIFINAHLSAVSARGNARKMLEHCGIDPATAQLQVGQ